MSYKAFISYSHAADGQLAPAIQSALHRFAKPWYRLRAVNVFRDKSSLSASPGLWPSIEQALADSEFFLLCASPASAASKWVRQEVEWWLGHRTAEKMLILLTEGELAWDAAVLDFDWPRTTSIAPGLSKQFRDEPLFVDLRWARGADDLSLRHSQFRGAILDLAAPLHGRPKDELDGEDVRQHRRTRLISTAAVLGILLFAVAAVWQAIEATSQRRRAEEKTIEAQEQRNEARRQEAKAKKQTKLAIEREAEAKRQKAEAERQKRIATEQRDRALASLLRVEANRLSSVEGQWDLAALLAVESLRKEENPGTYDLLSKLLTSGALPSARIITKGGGTAVAFSPDGQLVATGDYDDLIVFRAQGGREILRIPHAQGLLRDVRFAPSGNRILAVSDDHIRLFELPKGAAVAELEQGSSNALLGFSGNGRFVARAEGTKAWIRDAEDLRELAAADHTEPITRSGSPTAAASPPWLRSSTPRSWTCGPEPADPWGFPTTLQRSRSVPTENMPRSTLPTPSCFPLSSTPLSSGSSPGCRRKLSNGSARTDGTPYHRTGTPEGCRCSTGGKSCLQVFSTTARPSDPSNGAGTASSWPSEPATRNRPPRFSRLPVGSPSRGTDSQGTFRLQPLPSARRVTWSHPHGTALPPFSIPTRAVHSQACRSRLLLHS